MIEYKILRGLDQDVQKTLNQWKHQYALDTISMHPVQSGVVLLVSRTLLEQHDPKTEEAKYSGATLTTIRQVLKEAEQYDYQAEVVYTALRLIKGDNTLSIEDAMKKASNKAHD